MSDSELHELACLALAQTDTSFQFWISATFAVIVVAHFASRHISGIFLALITFLYVLTTAILMTRITLAATMYRQYIAAIEQFPFPTELGPTFVILRTTILFVGTVSALAYLVYSYYRSRSSSNDTDDA